MNYCIEIATTDYTTTEQAVNGGADRIELCSALSEGGLTPSFGLVKQCREKFNLPLFPIVRPRGGDFLYGDSEFEIITKDVLLCKQLNCDGVVVGFLKKDGTVDQKKTELIVKLAYPMEVTFHRAFDRCKVPLAALEVIIEAGCQRILTSGQQQKAIDGLDLIKKLIVAADNRIVIMPGSGIKPDNIRMIAEATGAVEFHGALRNSIVSDMGFVHPVFSAHDYTIPWINEMELKSMRKTLEEAGTININ